MLFRTLIPLSQRGLLFKDNDYIKLLLPGRHFTMPSADVKLFEVTDEFLPPIDLSILLKDSVLSNELEIISVKQNEICLIFEDQVCTGLLDPGRHAFWKSGKENRSFRLFDLNQPTIDSNELDLHVFQQPNVLTRIRVYTVESFEIGGLYIDRKFSKILQPGDYIFWKNAYSIDVSKVDMRLQHTEIPSQELLTKDRVTIRLNFVFQYKVVEAATVLNSVKDLPAQLYLLFQLALREYVGNLTLDEILQQKEEIGPFILERLKSDLQTLGLTSNQAGVKDIILPGEIRDIMNQVLLAEKRAQANVITRREETASTRNLLNTAKLMEENPLLYRLKELEYIERLTEKVNQINVNGGGQLIDQLRQILMNEK